MQDAPNADFETSNTSFLELLSSEDQNRRPATAALALIQCQEVLLREEERPHVAVLKAEIQAQGVLDRAFGSILEQGERADRRAEMALRKAQAGEAEGGQMQVEEAVAGEHVVTVVTRDMDPADAAGQQDAMLRRMRSQSTKGKLAARFAAPGSTG